MIAADTLDITHMQKARDAGPQLAVVAPED